MWEAIRANRCRSIVLIAAMFMLLAALGGSVGWLLGDAFGQSPGRWAWTGVGLASALWGGQLVLALLAGRSILLGTAGARQVTKEDAPRLFNVVEEMTLAASLPRMPDIYVVDADEPNAFAVGTRPEQAAVAVTTGLLRRMDRDELQGVIAHEIGHVASQDVRFMTIAGVLVGTIVMISDSVRRSLFRGAMLAGRRSSRKGGGALPILLVVLVLAILAPILARLLYFACSRSREFLADACAARFTRFPEGLARALEKISSPAQPGGAATVSPALTDRVIAPMCIVNPLDARSFTGLFATHPPTQDRIRVLRAMQGGAGFLDYRDAMRRALRSDGGFLVGLDREGRLAARAPSADAGTRACDDRIARAREAIDLLDRVAGFALVACPCGVRVKVPPAWREPEVTCVRCGRTLPVPAATTSTQTEPRTVAAAAPDEPRPFYRRGGQGGWESFRCLCGATVQLSPAFAASQVECRACRRTIRIEPPAPAEGTRGG